MTVNAALILAGGIIIYLLVYYFRVKKIDRDVMKCDPSRATPAKVYMDGGDAPLPDDVGGRTGDGCRLAHPGMADDLVGLPGA